MNFGLFLVLFAVMSLSNLRRTSAEPPPKEGSCEYFLIREMFNFQFHLVFFACTLKNALSLQHKF
jgi:hypothetical protein